MSLHSTTDEKVAIEKVDSERADSSIRANPEDAYDPSFVRSTMRKVDIRLLPILGALYAFSLIDRTNISLARIVGAGAELRLDLGQRYSIIALVFFPPYIILELPSNLVLRRVGAALWLGTISMLWGATMTGMGFVKNWHALAGCRAVLGALEAGFFPGCVYLISTWYIRREVQARLAFFYLLSTLIAGFVPIMAYLISTIGEAGGLLAWRWIFIISGLGTCFFAALAFFLVVDFPDKAKFLTPEQIKLVRDRVEYDRGDVVPDKLTVAKALEYALDLKLWAFALMFMSATMPSYAFSFFLPVILAGMGFSVKDSQLLTSPPYVFAVIAGITFANIADRVNKRGPFIIFQALVTIVGLAMTAFTTTNASRYAGCFLGLFGCQSNIPAVLAYQSNNIVGQSKRAFTSALVVGFGGVGGIIASVAFSEKDAPTYRPGLWASIAFQVLMITLCSMTSVYFWYCNRQVARGTGKVIEKTNGFFYTL